MKTPAFTPKRRSMSALQDDELRAQLRALAKRVAAVEEAQSKQAKSHKRLAEAKVRDVAQMRLLGARVDSLIQKFDRDFGLQQVEALRNQLKMTDRNVEAIHRVVQKKIGGL